MPSTIPTAILCAVISLAAGMGVARAEDTPTQSPRAITTATAFIPNAGEVFYSGGLDHKFQPSGFATIGLAKIAEVGLSLDREWTDPSAQKKTAMAHFKMGSPEGFLHSWMPAFAILYRKSLKDSVQFFSGTRIPRLATLSVLASKNMGPISVHLGGELLSAQMEQEQSQHKFSPTLAIEWHPAQYPKTTLLADLRWIPSETNDLAITPIWNLAWGVTYQAFTWASVDLNVRHQEGESSNDAVVTLGLAGSFSFLRPEPLDLSKSTRRNKD